MQGYGFCFFGLLEYGASGVISIWWLEFRAHLDHKSMQNDGLRGCFYGFKAFYFLGG